MSASHSDDDKTLYPVVIEQQMPRSGTHTPKSWVSASTHQAEAQAKPKQRHGCRKCCAITPTC